MTNNQNNEKITRISPHSIEAEEAVLGCMLINNESVLISGNINDQLVQIKWHIEKVD